MEWNQVNWVLSFELIPWASPRRRKSIFKWSNLLKKIQIVDLHVVVIVNCDLIYAEEIASKELKTNLVGEALLVIIYWRHGDYFGTEESVIQKLSTRKTSIVLERHSTPNSSTFVDYSACYTLMAAWRLQICLKFQFLDSRALGFKLAQDLEQ